jgi:hypothetical protein
MCSFLDSGLSLAAGTARASFISSASFPERKVIAALDALGQLETKIRKQEKYDLKAEVVSVSPQSLEHRPCPASQCFLHVLRFYKQREKSIAGGHQRNLLS